MHPDDFNQLVYNGSVSMTTNWITPTPANATILNGGTAISPSGSLTFNITLPSDQAWKLNDSYIRFQVGVQATTATNSVATFLTPNFLAGMTNSITINSGSFSYTFTSALPYHTASVLSTMLRLRSYNANQNALVTKQQNALFTPTTTYLDSTDVVTGASVSSTSDAQSLNQGLLVAPGFVTAATQYTSSYIVDFPLLLLLPMIDEVNLLNGSNGTTNITWNYSYNDQYTFSAGVPNTTGITTTNPAPVLATINNFTLTNVQLFIKVAQFRNQVAPGTDVQRIRTMNLTRYQAIEQTWTATGTAGAQVGGTPGSALSLTSIVSVASNSLASNGKALTIFVAPYVRCDVSNGKTPLVYNIATGTNKVSDTFTMSSQPVDNFLGYNINFLMNGLFSLGNFNVSSGKGTVYPINNPAQYYGPSTQYSVDFQSSFVEQFGSANDGSDSKTCIPYILANNYFKAYIVDVSNETSSQGSNANQMWTIRYNVYPTLGAQYGAGPGGAIYTFGAEIFIFSAITE